MTTTTRQSKTPAIHYLADDHDHTASLDDRAGCGRRRGDMIGTQYTNDPAEVTCKRCVKTLPAPVEPTPAPAGREARTWDATTAETHTCAGACGETLPAKSFPTTSTTGRRGIVCRADRDAARSAA